MCVQAALVQTSVLGSNHSASKRGAARYLSATAAGFWDVGVAHTEAPANFPHV
jgi:hypothetical protein